MRHRCRNPKHPFYDKYGARGITVCDAWYDSFEKFLDDMGKRPTLGHSIDRIDGTKGYRPDNCRWATRSEQAQNQVRSSKGRRQRHPPVTYNGVTRTITEWADHVGISRTAMAHRLSTYGWTLDEALGGKPRNAQRGHPRLHFIEWNGVTKHVRDWAAQAGMSHETLAGRYYRLGWSMDRAMTAPVKHWKNRKPK